MKRNTFYFTVITLLVSSAQCFAAPPPMPGMTSGIGDHGMKHAGIGLTGTVLTVHYDTMPIVPLTMMSGHETDYTPAKFEVLEDVYFNAQYGWSPDGFISLPADRLIWIERTGTIQPIDAIFKVYEAGNMSMNSGEGMANWTMDEIHTSDGEIWQSDGVMQHDYYTADMRGSYSMMFDVYVGDLSGVRDTDYTPVSTTFRFTVVPEPATLALAMLGIYCMVVRRR
jgi:hypothetical protein